MTGIRQSWTALVLAAVAAVLVVLAFAVATVVLTEGIPPEGWGYSPADSALMVGAEGVMLVAVLVIAAAVFAVGALRRAIARQVRVRSFVALALVVLTVLLGILPAVVYSLLV